MFIQAVTKAKLNTMQIHIEPEKGNATIKVRLASAGLCERKVNSFAYTMSLYSIVDNRSIATDISHIAI